MDRVDFIRAVAEQSLPRLERIVYHFLPNGEHQGREYVCLNPTRADNRLGSFRINLDTGQWADFATENKGGDVVSLVAYLDGGNQGKAAKEIANLLGISDLTSPRTANIPTAKADWTPLVPIPEDAPAPPNCHYKHGEPSHRWTYCNADGEVVCHVCRFETTEGKTFKPLTFCESSDGRRDWRWKGLPDPRPLYHSDLLQKYPEAIVITCEGEKAADAATTLFPLPDYVTTTALNGAQSPGKTDWTPLAHRTVWIWPDNDKAGRGFADAVCKLIRAAQQEGPQEEAGSIHEIRLDGFKRLPDGTERELPPKWDAADAVAEGFTAEHINNVFLADPANLLQLKQESPPDVDPVEALGLPSSAQTGINGFVLVQGKKGWKNGLYAVFNSDDSGEPTRIWLCSPIQVNAIGRGFDNTKYAIEIEFDAICGAKQNLVLPRDQLLGDGTDALKQLAGSGLDMVRRGKPLGLLLDFLHEKAAKVTPIRIAEQTGWVGNAFVLPDAVFGARDNEPIVFRPAGAARVAYGVSGTLAQWQQHVAEPCIGNSRLILAVSTAFASMLLELARQEGGGVHLQGPSSIGKTIALMAAASVFGHGLHFIENWRATDNGLEGIAHAHNGTLLPLDELGQVDPRFAGETAYMLANGQGKSRANRYGGARERMRWLELFLSTGELSLSDLMQAAGKTAKAGQEVRLITVPADTGKFGLFENLHHCTDGAQFAHQLSAATKQFYGAASHEFLRQLVDMPRIEVTETLLDYMSKFTKEYLPKGAEAQVGRLADRFALIAAAGKFSTAMGITGWPAGAAEEAVAACLKGAIVARGGLKQQEEIAALRQVRKFFEQHGESRFTPIGTPETDARTQNRAGFRETAADRSVSYYVFPESWRSEVCKGFDVGFVNKALKRRGHLEVDQKGRSSVSCHRPGWPRRIYHVYPSVLDGDADDGQGE